MAHIHVSGCAILGYYGLKKEKRGPYAKHKQGNMERLLGGAIAELGRKLGDCFAVEHIWTIFHYSH